jgi:hypothetical protein
MVDFATVASQNEFNIRPFCQKTVWDQDLDGAIMQRWIFQQLHNKIGFA